MKRLKAFYKRLKLVWFCYRYPGRGSSDTYKKYRKEFNFNGKKILNLGCGNSIYPAKNVVNLDMFPKEGINVVWDLSKTPLPFKDEEFDHIIANHILEHVPGWWECFKELARIVKKNGLIEVWLPGDGGTTQLGYRDHINVINGCSFFGIKGTIRNKCNLWEENQHKDFEHTRKLTLHTQKNRLIRAWWLQLLPNRLVDWCVYHLRNVVAETGYFFIRGE